ncbi:hypothetical protein ACF0H5_014612 [Mactra antiquata]
MEPSSTLSSVAQTSQSTPVGSDARTFTSTSKTYNKQPDESQTDSSVQKSDDNSSTFIGAAVGGGAVVVIAAVVIILVCFIKRRSTRNNHDQVENPIQAQAIRSESGPTASTMNEYETFWEMVWQHNVETIVMLTILEEGVVSTLK